MNMKTALIALLTAWLGCVSLQAAQPVETVARVKGLLVDSLTQSGEPYATLRVVQNEAEAPVAMGVTDMDGRFSIALPRYGTYVLHVTSVGREPLAREFNVSSARPEADLGTMYSRESSEMLEGVEVVAQKPLVKMDIDEISYSVADDPDANTNTTLEMLRKVPMVTVDGEDNIKVNGSSSFQVYVNGKPSAMMSANPSQTLKALPASSIKSIEVQTNPGAKYDAEGVGGILNITMDDSSGLEGYNLSLNASAGNLTQGGGAYAMVQSGKLTLSANVNATHVRIPEMDIENLRDEAQTGNRLDYAQNIKGNTQLLFGNFDASYEIDTLNSLSVSVGLFHMPQQTDGLGTTLLSNNGQTLFGYDTRLKNRNKSLSVNGSVDYRHTFRNNPRHNLLLAYRIGTQPKENKATSLFTIGGSSEEAQAAGLVDRYSTDRNNMLEHTFQADYTLPLGTRHEVEMGAKYVLRRSSSESEEVDYRHNSDIAAAYGSYNLRAGKWGMKAGVRYEHTHQNVSFLRGNGTDFSLNYNNVVPALSLNYNFGNGHQLGAGYNLRISRPGIGYLNPYVDDQDPTHVTYGNPTLEPEKAHNLNLNYSLFTTRFMLNASLRHSFLNNAMEEFTRYDDNVLYTTYGNIGKRRTTELSLFLNWSILPQTRLTVNSTTSYIDLRSPSLGYRNHGWQQSVMASVQHTLPCKIKLSGNYFGSTSGITLQGRSGGFNVHTLGISRAFLKDDRLNISLNAINPFSRSMKITSETAGADFTNRMRTSVKSRAFMVGFTLRLGNLKPSQKKVAASSTDIRDREDSSLPLNSIMMTGGEGGN